MRKVDWLYFILVMVGIGAVTVSKCDDIHIEASVLLKLLGFAIAWFIVGHCVGRTFPGD